MEQLRAFWERIRADIHKNPGLWLGVGISAAVLIVAYLAYMRSSASGQALVPGNGYGIPDYTSANGGSSGLGSLFGGYSPYQPYSSSGYTSPSTATISPLSTSSYTYTPALAYPTVSYPTYTAPISSPTREPATGGWASSGWRTLASGTLGGVSGSIASAPSGLRTLAKGTLGGVGSSASGFRTFASGVSGGIASAPRTSYTVPHVNQYNTSYSVDFHHVNLTPSSPMATRGVMS